MQYRLWRLAGALGMLAAVQLAGCSPAESPAEVCAAAGTQAQAKTLLGRAANEAAAKLRAMLPVPNVDFADPKQSSAIKLDLVTLVSADKTTGKVTCAGQAALDIPADLRGKLKGVATGDSSLSEVETLLSGGQAQLTFSRQLQADGKGFVYALDGGPAVDAIEVAWVIATAAEAQAHVAAVPAEPVEPAPLSDSPAADSSAAAAPASPEAPQ